MNAEMVVLITLTIITAATPLVYAAIGELVVEKSGALNLGVEGMMLGGAVSSFALLHLTGNAYFGILGGAFAGVCLLYTSPSPRDRQKSRMPSSA